MQFNDLQNELSTNFIENAVAVNSDRAIPDAKSGLKPVAKRILYGAYSGGRTSNKPHVKSARVVGDVMGQLHPHGDSSIYGALVRLAQPWIMRYPLIDFHGNMGNVDGDGPAAARYTEVRLSKISEDGLLTGLKKNCVDFIPNYDETTTEPVTLPSIFPNLLCNPNTGIGIAVACNWLPHNLNEVAQAIYDYMNGKEQVTIPGPDFPTGGIIINKNDIPSILKSGHGSVKVRGRYRIEKQNIIFYEIPYGIKTEDLLSEIGKVCDNKEIEGINEIRNESNKKGIRIVIECEKSVTPESIVNKLFLKTNLQTSISYNQIALIDKTPTELNFIDCIKIYIEHNINCIVRECDFDLQKAKARLEILNGLLKALEDIDNIINLIKKSESANAAKVQLIEKYAFTENQAKAILDMKLAKLANLEQIELQKEKAELINHIEELNVLLLNPEVQKAELRKRLEAFVLKFGDARRTELMQIDSIDPREVDIEPEDVVVSMTATGLIKRVPTSNFKTQKRNGKGKKTEDNSILDTISTNTVDTLMLFSDKGKMYRLSVNDVPETTNAAKGSHINSLIELDSDENIVAINSLYKNSTATNVVFFTKKGYVKKTLLSEYKNIKRSGTIAIKLKEDDGIANVTFLNEEEVILITKNGNAIRFETSLINPIGRNTTGVKSIKLEDSDFIIAGLPIHKIDDKIAIVCKNGLGKKISINELPVQGRGGKGLSIIKGINSTIAGVAMVDNNDSILLIGQPNSICINAGEISEGSRTSNGNQLIKNSIIDRIVKL